jgi:hypothetical protein
VRQAFTLGVVLRGDRACKGHFPRSRMAYPEQAFYCSEAQREWPFLSRAAPTLAIGAGWDS